jgi:hypothetical protein
LYASAYVHAQPQYTFTDLGPLFPSAVAGPWVVGFEDPRNQQPVRFNHITGEKMILRGFGTWGAAAAVLPSGETSGYVAVPDTRGVLHQTAAYWNAAGQLMLLPGMPPSIAAGLSSGPMFAGVADANPPGTPVFWRAIRWWPDGRQEILGTLGGQTSWGNGIDAQGHVWGNARTSGSEDYPITARTHAAVFHLDGRVQDLGTLDGEYSNVSAVSPDAIGVGTSSAWAFTATVEGGITALPIPAGFDYCQGSAIASGGASVGVCTDGQGAPSLDIYHATLWPDATQVIDLNSVVNSLGWVLESARGISADGHIVGTMLRQGERRGYLLTPMPPSLAIALNQAALTPGDTLRVALTMDNPGPLLTVDHYIGIILTDGQTIVWLTHTAPLEGVVGSLTDNPAAFTPMLRGVSWPAGMHVTQADYFTHRVTGLEAPGTYYVVVGWTKPGSLQDGRIDEGNVVALAWTPFQLTGGPRVAAQ